MCDCAGGIRVSDIEEPEVEREVIDEPVRQAETVVSIPKRVIVPIREPMGTFAAYRRKLFVRRIQRQMPNTRKQF